MVMALADEQANILRSAACPTRSPEETLPDILAFFAGQDVCALGLASFGPLDVHPASSRYGDILNTPKQAWQNYPLLRRLTEALGVPGACDTDVNAAVLAEVRMGAAKGLSSCLYLTVGTGIGGGLYCENSLVHGLSHPEWGHMLLSPREDDPAPQGFCPFHRGCAEGLASGPALEKRWGVPGSALADSHAAFDLEAWYLAQVCVNAMMTVSPQRILLGGGVMQRSKMLPRIRQYVCQLQNGYLAAPGAEEMETYIQAPALFPVSGLVGAALLAVSAAP